MATYPKILSSNEIREFDEPPVFKSEDRKFFFDVPKFIENDFSEIRTDLNKLVFILLMGYFKCCKKFFIPATFNRKDINYVINKFNLDIKEPNLEKFNIRNDIIHGVTPSFIMILIAILYAVSYSLLLLVITQATFRKKDY